MQKGFVEGAWRGDVDSVDSLSSFRRALRARTDLDYLLRQGDRLVISIASESAEFWPFSVAVTPESAVSSAESEDSFMKPPQFRWRTTYGRRVDQLSAIEFESAYRTDNYSIGNDERVVWFLVCDGEWRCEAGHCVEQLEQALREAERGENREG